MSNELFRDPGAPLETRLDDLIGRLTLEEKVSQTLHDAPGVERLGIPAYNWWNECLHGVARAGVATVFPQAIGMAASFDTEMIGRVGSAISDEARAKHHAAVANGNRTQYLGLTFWSPNVNIFRDPRWGRGQETYGEDPYLTARLGVAFIQGLQGDDPTYLKVAACAKHYAVHSGPEQLRHTFDAGVSAKDLWETYLPAFEACVREAKVESVMGAYNRTNGEVCCGSPTLLQRILRERWGFAGHVVSDCGAVLDFHAHHKVTKTPEESAALAVKNGCNLNCGRTYASTVEAVKQGLISEDEINRSLKDLLRTRFKLGMFDPPEQVRYAGIPRNVVHSNAHRALALEAARKSIVLLKNDGVLPLEKDLHSIMVVGPTAADFDVLIGNYYGFSPTLTTILEGITGKIGAGTKLQHAAGCRLTGDSRAGFGMAKYVASGCDVIVAVMGISPRLEGEEGDAADSDGGGDRKHINLPGVQEELLKELAATGKPVVLVLTGGSAIAVPWAHEHVNAVVKVWYPGEAGGIAVGDVLFGDYSPAGKLPVTVPVSLDQLPPFEDYAMENRTYRYMRDEPLYPFGFGLSYTRFEYADLALSSDRVSSDGSLELGITVTNSGKRAGEEVVQVYFTDLEASVRVPRYQLCRFQRIALSAGESRRLTFRLDSRELALVDDDGNRVLEPGRFRITVGGSSPGERSRRLGAPKPAEAELEVV